MSVFKFKFFDIKQSDAPMKVGTDAMVLGASINIQDKKRGLDVGSGTGVLALMCVQRNPELIIEAVELDEMASKECDYNFKKSNYSDQLSATHRDFLKFDSTQKFDLVLSNPPYFQSRLENDDKRKSNSRHERSLPKEKFVKRVASLMDIDGDFWIIVPYIDAHGWVDVAMENKLLLNRRVNLIGKEGGEYIRVILNFSFEKKNVTENELTIRDFTNNYTSDYIELTKEFHFKHLKKKEA